jgi:hypothetical protein
MCLLLSTAAVIGLLAAMPQPAFAQFYGPGPWCAVTDMGTGNWSLQQCVPHVLSGNRGFCNQNPSFIPKYRTDRRRYR